MRRYWPVGLLAAILIFAVFQRSDTPWQTSDTPINEHRIISLAPSITETLYAVGAASQLIAVSDYCTYPAEVKKLPSIGGYLDPSLEQILRFQPDLVVMLEQQQKLDQQLQQLGIATLMVEHTTLNGILNSITQIGEATGNATQAATVLHDIEMRIEQVNKRVADQPVRPTLLVVAHYTDSDQIHHLYLAGQRDFYNDLLTLAGGINVYQHTLLKVPTISTEGILRLNPDVIIDIFPEAGEHPADLARVRQRWNTLSQIKAVQQQQVHLIEAGYAVVPGPRIIHLLEDFADILHPDTMHAADNDAQG